MPFSLCDFVLVFLAPSQLTFDPTDLPSFRPAEACVNNDATRGGLLTLTCRFMLVGDQFHPCPVSTPSQLLYELQRLQGLAPGPAFEVVPLIIHPSMDDRRASADVEKRKPAPAECWAKGSAPFRR